MMLRSHGRLGRTGQPLRSGVLASVLALTIAGCGQGDSTDETAPPPQMRLMSESQYRNTIADVLGDDIQVVGRFETAADIDGLAALSASQMSISSRGYERYYGMAATISDQAIQDENWAQTFPCPVPADDAFDESCARSAITDIGERLLRRPLSAQEIDGWVEQSRTATDALGSFKQAMSIVVEGFLASPEFLFLIDQVEDEPKGEGARLTAMSKASRLSYFLWNSAPDAELLAVAADGSLHSDKVMKAQVDRMLASDKINDGAQAFFEDFLNLDGFETLNKDKLIYPAFNKQVAVDARAQVLKFLNYHLLDQNEAYSSIFTARDTFMSRPLGMIYRVPVAAKSGWEPYRFGEGDPRAGLLSHIGFTALHSHPGRSSATLRGIAVRELLLCQPVAPAPAAVNFTVVQDTENPDFKTARARLTQHRTDAACKSCHEFIDPIGLALENFDGAGKFRMSENGELIDASGELDAKPFANLTEMEAVLASHPAAPACLVEKLQKYATGRETSTSDLAWRRRLEKRFTRKGQNLRDLLKTIATSDEFFAVEAVQPEAAAQTVSLDQRGKDT